MTGVAKTEQVKGAGSQPRGRSVATTLIFNYEGHFLALVFLEVHMKPFKHFLNLDQK